MSTGIRLQSLLAKECYYICGRPATFRSPYSFSTSKFITADIINLSLRKCADATHIYLGTSFLPCSSLRLHTTSSHSLYTSNVAYLDRLLFVTSAVSSARLAPVVTTPPAVLLAPTLMPRPSFKLSKLRLVPALPRLTPVPFNFVTPKASLGSGLVAVPGDSSSLSLCGERLPGSGDEGQASSSAGCNLALPVLVGSLGG